MTTLIIHKRGNQVIIDDCSRTYEAGELLLYFLNSPSSEQLKKLYAGLKKVKKDLVLPLDEPYDHDYTKTVYKAQGYMTAIDEYLLSLPPYCDMRVKTPEGESDGRLISLLNQYKHLFVGGYDPDAEFSYEDDQYIPKDENDSLYIDDEFALSEYGFKTEKGNEQVLFKFEPDIPVYDQLDSDYLSSAMELAEKTNELVDEYAELASQSLRVHYVYKPMLEHLHDGLTAMPSEQEINRRVAQFISGNKAVMNSYETMNPAGSISVSYDAVPDGDSVTIERVTMYQAPGDYLYAELFESLLCGQLPKKCKHCGRYFMMKAGYYTEYCQNVAPGETEKTCREVGARKSFDDKVRNDPVWLVHQRAYKAHYARMMKKKMTKPEFLQWSDMALELRAQALKGEISFEEYEAELKK